MKPKRNPDEKYLEFLDRELRTFTVMIWVLIPIFMIDAIVCWCIAPHLWWVGLLLFLLVPCCIGGYFVRRHLVLKEEERLEQLIKQQKSVNGEEYEKK